LTYAKYHLLTGFEEIAMVKRSETQPPHIEEFISLGAAKRAVEVPVGYMPVLGALLAEPGATPTQLCEATQENIDTMSRVLKVLRTDHAVVDFEPDRHDQRKKHFYLTPKGVEQLRAWLKMRGIAAPENAFKVKILPQPKAAKSRVIEGK
jgi:DNA-binding MarR family transcriptional regulator